MKIISLYLNDEEQVKLDVVCRKTGKNQSGFFKEYLNSAFEQLKSTDDVPQPTEIVSATAGVSRGTVDMMEEEKDMMRGALLFPVRKPQEMSEAEIPLYREELAKEGTRAEILGVEDPWRRIEEFNKMLEEADNEKNKS